MAIRPSATRQTPQVPWTERLMVAARRWSAPLGEVERRVPPGRVLDLGCGHGVLAELLASRPGRTVVAVDPDERKVAWARQRLQAFPNVEVHLGTVERFAGAGFDAVVTADVLYLLPVGERARFLEAIRRCLKPGGALVLKDAEGDGSWRHVKALAQEWLMVRALRRTRGGGGLSFQPRAALVGLVEAAGFEVTEVVSLSRGYTTPHLLIASVAR